MIRERTGYFARWADARRKLARIVEQLEAGRTVHLCTYTHATKLTRKHIGQLRATPSGFAVLHGRSWLNHDYSAIKVYA